MFEEDKKVATYKIEPSLKNTFMKLCKQKDSTASQEIRKFVKQYIRKHGQAQLDFTDDD